MASVSSVTSSKAATSTAATTATASGAAAATSKLSTNSDFDRFLTLLTAQMKFQNPLEPTDPTQFVAQLAQFSQVEQQTKTNKLLEGIATALNGGESLAESAALLGRSVQTETAKLILPGSGTAVPVTFNVTSSTLKNPRLEILDEKGSVVRQISAKTGTTSITYDGRDGSGVALPAGSYGARVVGEDSDGKRQVAGSVTGSGKITEIRRDSSGAMHLVLDNGSVISASDIARLGS